MIRNLLHRLLARDRGQRRAREALTPARTRLDAELERCREAYRDGPVGVWRTFHDLHLGLGFDGTGLFGDRIHFDSDGTGEIDQRSALGADEHSTFRWTATGPYQIDIVLLDHEQSTGEAGGPREEEPVMRLEYEFFAVPDYGVVLMREVGPARGDAFWVCPGPVRLVL